MDGFDELAKQDLDEGGTGSERVRSSIEFPYLDLDNAIEIAKAVHALQGQGCEWDQLGAKFGVSTKGIGFQMRVHTAKTFGLVSYDRSTVTLTGIGIRVTDAQQESTGRIDAFLSVPLYRLICEQFKAGPVPGAAAIESFMVSVGIADNVKERARQVFTRSARQAGFFEQRTDHMRRPLSAAGGRRAGDKESSQQDGGDPSLCNASSTAGTQLAPTQLAPIVEGLLKTLPPTGSCWEVDRRAKWLQAAVNIFDLIYTTGDHSKTLSVHID